MKDIQEVFSRIQEKKAKLRDLRTSYKDGLASSSRWVELKEEVTILKEKLKSIEQDIKAGFTGEFQQIDDLKIDIASDQELLTDIAINTMINGDSADITDRYDNEYEPKFSCKFKKIK